MGATNRKDVLDAALTRPGRFDRSIEVRRPDFSGRMECCQVHLREKPLGEDIDFKKLGSLTGGMSGAQIAGMCNLASFVASREGRSEVAMSDLIKAVEQSKYGRAYELNKFVSPTRKRR
jgi:cell division protease FtsH